MNMEKFLLQRSYLYFAAFLLLALTGFWFTYFTRILDQENYRMHLHGVTLFTWSVMLVSQAYLIRQKNNALHRKIGKLSYVVVPILLFTTVDLLKFKVGGVQVPGTMDFFFVALVLNALLVFVIFYGLAIYFKRTSGLHARWMVCTVFPMFTPVTDRLIGVYFRGLIPYMPTIEGNYIRPVAGFILCDLMLLGLCIADRNSGKNRFVFPAALILMLAYHYSVMNFYKFEFWQSFSTWFIQF